MVMRKQDWTPATEFRVVRLKANGPKAGQSVQAWQRGKDKEQVRFDAAKARKLQRGEL